MIVKAKSNIVYKISCKECLAEKIMANYFGESNFNGFTRGKRHLENDQSQNKETMEKSAMRRHDKEVHNKRNVEFQMEIIKTFQHDALGRQVYGSTKILESKIRDDYPLNSKNEYNQAMIVMARYQKGVHSNEENFPTFGRKIKIPTFRKKILKKKLYNLQEEKSQIWIILWPYTTMITKQPSQP